MVRRDEHRHAVEVLEIQASLASPAARVSAEVLQGETHRAVRAHPALHRLQRREHLLGFAEVFEGLEPRGLVTVLLFPLLRRLGVVGFNRRGLDPGVTAGLSDCERAGGRSALLDPRQFIQTSQHHTAQRVDTGPKSLRVDVDARPALEACQNRKLALPLGPTLAVLIPEPPAERGIVACIGQQSLRLALAYSVVPRAPLHPVAHLFRDAVLEQEGRGVREAASVAEVGRHVGGAVPSSVVDLRPQALLDLSQIHLLVEGGIVRDEQGTIETRKIEVPRVPRPRLRAVAHRDHVAVRLWVADVLPRSQRLHADVLVIVKLCIQSDDTLHGR